MANLRGRDTIGRTGAAGPHVGAPDATGMGSAAPPDAGIPHPGADTEAGPTGPQAPPTPAAVTDALDSDVGASDGQGVAVGELDLALDRSAATLPDRPTLLLIRDHGRVLGEAFHPKPSAADWDELVFECAQQVAWRFYAHRVLPVPPDPEALHTAADVSVVICTRDRPDLLVGALGALAALDPAPREVIVVDNASRSPRTREVGEAAGFRVIREDRPGLDNARNAGWQAATGALIAYVDDDARVDRRWASALADAFSRPDVGLVTGLVLPAEISTRAQRVFERNGGMRKGYERRSFGADGIADVGLAAHRVGVGTNMSFRRDVLAAVGGFDPHLDVGTATGGGGDLEMLHRILHAGHTGVYQPDAVVRHRHRTDLRGWIRQIQGNGRGFNAYLESVALRHPELADDVRRHRRTWHRQRHVVAPLRALRNRDKAEFIELVVEGVASIQGPAAYRALLDADGRP